MLFASLRPVAGPAEGVELSSFPTTLTTLPREVPPIEQ